VIIKNAKVLTGDFKFRETDVEIDYGKFVSLNPLIDCEYIDADGKFMVPGLIDIHTHGAVGYDNSDTDEKAISAIAEFMIKNGTTSYAPTLMTISSEDILTVCDNVKNYISAGERYAKIAGIHMEGPFFASEYKGAQNEAYIRNPDINEMHTIQKHSGNLVKLISLAPEKNGAYEFIEEFGEKLVISIGHSGADYDVAKAAIEKGVRHMTHTFNAMKPLKHREPNALGAAFESDITCECICDGLHIHPSVIRMLYKILGEDRLVLISDSIRAAGMDDGEYTLGGLNVIVKDKKATLTDGTIAGSTSTLLSCVKKAIEFGIPSEIAFKSASLNPARVMGVDKYTGSIEVGKAADFLLLDKNYNLCAVYKDGKKII